MMQGSTQGTEPEAQSSSSSMVALRTFVMIAFLVAIPLFAILGAGLPDSLRTAMQGRAANSFSDRPAPRVSEPAAGASALAAAPLADEPRADPAAAGAPANIDHSPQSARPMGAGQSSLVSQPRAGAPLPERLPQAAITAVRPEGAAPRARITQVRTLPEAAAPAPIETAPLWAPAPRTAQTPRGRQTTAHFEPSGSRLRELAQKAAGDSPLQATAYSTPAPSSAASEAPNDAFARGERRLREFGASHYRLETWGERGELFRCTANVRLPNRRGGMRHFEATAAAPAQAIEQLLAKIEAWREARR